MNGTSFERGMDKQLLSLRIIWAAMLGSLALYALLAYYINLSGVAPALMEPDVYKLLRYVLMAAGMLILGLTRPIRKKIMTGAWQSKSFGPKKNPILSRYASATIVSLALCESLGIYGLVLYLIQRDTITFYIFLIASALAMSAYRPRREELEDLIRLNQT